MDWKMIVDTLLANPALWWPVVGGAMSFGFKWLAPRAPALHEILAAFSPDVPRLLNGIRMLWSKDARALPPVSAGK